MLHETNVSRNVADMDWELFLYRLPPEPSSARVAVWRELRRLGALPLAQSVVAVPALGELPARLDAIEQRVHGHGGTSYRFVLAQLSDTQTARLEADWNAIRSHEYAEIVEECLTKFLKEVEFEIFRDNLTSSEAEEIEADLDKIRAWRLRIVERDHFGAPGRPDVDRAVKACERAYDDFVERVYRREQQAGGAVLDPPEAMPWGEVGEPGADVVDLPGERAPRRRRTRQRRESA
jgi:hypothetical protein